MLNMLPYLKAAGFESCILFEPAYPNETPDLSGVAARAIDASCDVVVLQKVSGPSALSLARQLNVAGIRTVFSVCDLVDNAMVEATDATVIVTDFLKSLYSTAMQSRIHVVHDGIEQLAVCKIDWSSHRGGTANPLQAVLVTSSSLASLPVLGQPPGWLNVHVVGRYERGLRRLKEIRWTWAMQAPGDRLAYVSFLINRRIQCVPWDSLGVYREMKQADIGVIPIDTRVAETDVDALSPVTWNLKSENRLTMKMSMGLPVIATPIPSYESVITHGVNGFFARSPNDWVACLSALRDPARRREMGLAARAAVVERFSMEAQSIKLIRVLEHVITTANSNGRCG